MRDFHKNIFYILWTFGKDFSIKSYESLVSLFSGKKIEKSGIFFSWIHHIFFIGPEEFQKNPKAITIGRAFITPLAFLISHTRTYVQDTKK